MKGVALLLTGVLLGCNEDENSSPPMPPDPPTVEEFAAVVDASTVTGTLRPLWGDHYDLSFEHFNYADEPGFSELLTSLAPRSWRCSVGRWEIGFPPPTGGDSLDPAALMMVEREFYRGPNTMVGADDPANYDFTYLDAQLAGLVAEGVQPFLCFDYMPFTLSSEQDPSNPENLNILFPGTPYSTYSFSNGIRTAPPADPAVYARVVRNTVRHVRGFFAGTIDYGIDWIEIGNEPDLVDELGATLPYFWTGDATEFHDMYAAIAAEIDAAPSLVGFVELGAGSFAFLPSMTGTAFLSSFVADVVTQGTRLDYLSFHSYGDLPSAHVGKFNLVLTITQANGLSAPWVNAEWGRNLGGLDPVYDQIEHGLMRAEVLAFMQLYPFQIAHEAVFRNPGTQSGELGLVHTGPPAHKPVSHVYQALALFDDALNALDVTANTAGQIVLAGSNAGGTRVVVAVLVQEPAPDTVSRITLDLESLPWGPASYVLTRKRVTQASSDSGPGVETTGTQNLSGPTLESTVDVNVGEAGLYIWELDKS